ncbi:MAG: PA14 domain-containing protein [Proteobacteria bacterium]|nr:PA14 domain-containing protein [Pseudomonadota bacterium]
MSSITAISGVARRGLVATLALTIFSWSIAEPALADHITPNDFAPEQEQLVNPAPAAPQPEDSELAAGLATQYWKILVRDIKEIADLVGRRKAKAGAPIMNIDFKVGPGNILTSGLSDGVGAEIKGFIRLDKTGTYRFLANSNDGVRITIDGELVLEDPDVHADQMTNWADVNVTEPGWYDFRVLYFERKNTATLQFYWQAPGADDYEIVPASVFAHRKN